MNKLPGLIRNANKTTDWNLHRFLPEDLPDPEDKTELIQSIQNIRRFYKIPVSDVARGKFVDMETNVGLTSGHCTDLGMFAKEGGEWALAIQWLFLAYKKSRDVQAKMDLRMQIEDAIAQHRFGPKRAPLALKIPQWTRWFNFYQGEPTLDCPLEFTGYESDQEFVTLFQSCIKVHDQEQDRKWRSKVEYLKMVKTTRALQAVSNDSEKSILFQAVCAGHNFQTEKEKSTLFCWYEFRSSLYYLIGPIKMELLASDPDIIRIYNVIGPERMRSLQGQTQGHLRRGSGLRTVGEERKIVITREKISMDGYMAELDFGELLTHTRLIPKFKPVDEKPGLRLYAFGGQFLPHVHYDLPAALREKKAGPDFLFHLTYLSNVTLGGFTGFPILGMAASPIPGSTILWFDVFNNGSIDPTLLHGGCPVILGRKFTAAIEETMYDQMWTYKCSTHQYGRFRWPVNQKSPENHHID